jgi:hypothetical protein
VKPIIHGNILLSAFILFGCNTSSVTDNVPDVPSKSEVTDAKARVGLSSEALSSIHAVLIFLGIIPVYTCGEPRSNFSGKLPTSLKTNFTGATITLDATDPLADNISLAFPANGSSVQGHIITGNLMIKTSGGEDRFTLELDARNAKIDGRTLQTVAGYGTCSDSTSYWADSQGPLTGQDATFLIKALVGKKAGLPVIGSTSLLVNATGSVTRTGKTDQLTLTSIDYEVGKLLPRSGTILILTSTGHRISADFSDDTPFVGQVKVKVDSKSTVSIPLPGYQ